MSDPVWLATARTLQAGRRIRIECCSNDKSLMVSNEAKGYRAYCFRCGPRGFVAHGDFSIDQLRRRREEMAWLDQRTVALPKDFTTEIPAHEATWLYRAGVNADTARHYRFGYSDSLRRVVLPVYQDDVLVGFTARSTIGAKPKYIERTLRPSETIFVADPDLRLTGDEEATGTLAGQCVVFTEDILSAVRVGRCVWRCVSLMGTSASAEQILRATQGASDTAVWLDPDRAGKRASADLVRTLRLIGMPTRVIRTDKDPKYYSNREIRRLLT
jgi:hypothetical protein